MELLFFSAFINLFKYTAISNAHKLAGTYQNYCCFFDLRELLYTVHINARLEKMQLAFFYIFIYIYIHIYLHIYVPTSHSQPTHAIEIFSSRAIFTMYACPWR